MLEMRWGQSRTLHVVAFLTRVGLLVHFHHIVVAFRCIVKTNLSSFRRFIVASLLRVCIT